MGFPCGSAGKESARNVGDLGSIPGLERSPREGKGYLLQYSGLENPVDCSLPGFSVHGILQARILVWVAFPFERIRRQCRRPWFDSRVRKICWRRDRLPIPVFLGFPCGSASKESTRNVGDLGSIPGLGRSPGEGKGYPFQYSSIENFMDCIVHGDAKSWTRLK